ncbi:MAG: glycoside hydrolase family 38 C-terminal domain-containing protein [Elusimicrobiota bacterium]
MNLPLYAELRAQLKERVHTRRLALPRWKMKEGDGAGFASPALDDSAWRDILATQAWGGYDVTAWFRATVTVPKELAGGPVVLLPDLQEGLLYLNGRPHQGVDRNHGEVLLSRRARPGEKFHIAIQAYSGRKPGPSAFGPVFLAALDPDALALHRAFTALEELEALLGPESAGAARLRGLVGRALAEFASPDPDSAEFSGAIGRAYGVLRAALAENRVPAGRGLVHLLPHSHIDAAWLWTLAETRRKCARTFSTALRLMEEFPEFSFSQSQALLYEYAKRHYPSVYAGIKRRVKEGRWHPIGAMWVEPDCNIPAGEALVRQVLYGKKFFREEFGLDQDILWLPDTFGYSWALPQILRKSGIKYFFTTKLAWNDTNRFPHSTFWWEGPDGSRVLAHIPPVGLEGQATPACLKKSWDGFREKKLLQHVAQTLGYGDGGGGPTGLHLEAARILANAPGLPGSRLSAPEEFFRESSRAGKKLPVWRGELYLEMHRGTYTTHGWIKKENRLAETALYNAELLSVLACLRGERPRAYPGGKLEGAWKELLLNQFHDIVPGTAIADAYHDARTGFDRLRSVCGSIRKRALGSLVAGRTNGAGRPFAVFNPLGWARSDYAILDVPAAEAFRVTGPGGAEIPHQIISSAKGKASLLCYVGDIPPFSFAELLVSPAAGPRPRGAWDVSGKAVDSPFFSLKLDGEGRIRSLFDKELGRELVAEGARANRFLAFRDAPPKWEAWEIDPRYEAQELKLFRFAGAKVLERGPLRSLVRLEYAAKSGSRISQDVLLYHRTRRIDFRTRVLWKEKRTMLKVSFPLAVRAAKADYGIQFGALSHPTAPSSPMDKAKYEIPFQQWTDLSEARFGVSLLNDCKYGFDVKGSALRLTLIRSPHYPHPVEPWWRSDPEATDQGAHEFTYSLYPHAGGWRGAGSVRRAAELNGPLIAAPGRLKSPVPALLAFAAGNIVVDCVKKAEEGGAVIVRAHEAHGVRSRTEVLFGARPSSVEECDLLEQNGRALAVKDSRCRVEFGPYEIKTLKLKFQAGRRKPC